MTGLNLEFLEEFTPKSLQFYMKNYNEKITREYEKDYNLQIINAFYSRYFKDKKTVNLKSYLIGANKSKQKKMNSDEMLDAIKKCHLAYGGKLEDLKGL